MSVQGCTCFLNFLQNYSECQILWSLCLVVFHTLTLRLTIQTSLSVVPELQVSLHLGENVKIAGKTSTSRRGVCLGAAVSVHRVYVSQHAI